VSMTRPSTSATAAGSARRRRLPRLGWRLRTWVMGAAALLVAAAVAVVVAEPFAGGGSSGVPDSGTATALATVERRSLSSQTLVDGTLGYAGSSSIVEPTGIPESDLRTAQQARASAQAALEAAEATLAGDQRALAQARAKLAADERALAQARAKLAADRLKQAIDCRGDGAAGGGSGGGSGDSSDAGSGSTPCADAAQALETDEESVSAAEQTVASDDAAVSAAEQKVTGDGGTIATARATLEGARRSLAAAESSATGHEATAAYTMLPSPGRVVRRGEALYAVDGRPVLLLYGRVTAWRAFRPAMSAGPDVAQLNANLRALGYGGPAGDSFTAATTIAIRALQAAHGLAPTGVLPLGSLVFKGGPVRVKSVTPKLGQTVQAGEVLSVTSTRHQVAIELDAAQQAAVEVGDPVVVTLPSGRTTPGRVSFVGSVASTPADGDSGDSSSSDSTPTIDVGVRLLRQAAAGRLDQAPVSVAITTASVDNVLVVPVNGLVALAGGGYAVEVVNAAGVHRLVPVSLGLFDDGQGLVQVSGPGVRAGQRIVVPAS
jgi:peptidoglycan hydrolase-like protein with peptidoglycan-binding domain